VGSDGGTTTIDDFSWGPFSAQDLSALAAYLVVGLVFLSIGLSVFSRRERVAHLVRRSHELVALGEQQARLASMQERSRIAREMHDIVAHSLSVMIALSDGARASVTRAPTAADEALDLLSQTGRSALADMRRMLGVLREGSEPQVEPGLVTPALPRPAPGADQVLDPGGPAGSDLAAEPARAMDPDLTAPTGPVAEVDLPTAPQPTEGADLDVLVDRFRRAGLPVRYRAAELPEHDGLRLAVYRVLQESLTNTLRHVVGAGAVDVVVAVVAARATVPARVVVTVTDDGGSHLPAARTPGPGRGLVGLQERAALFEGTASAGPYRGGWRVRVELVVPQDAGPRPSLVWRLPA
jgi:signal transduction histidine kinase